jgi:hypothetical protein
VSRGVVSITESEERLRELMPVVSRMMRGVGLMETLGWCSGVIIDFCMGLSLRQLSVREVVICMVFFLDINYINYTHYA